MRVCKYLLFVCVIPLACSEDPAASPKKVHDAGEDTGQSARQPRRPVPDLRFKWVGQAAHIHLTEQFIGLSSTAGAGLGLELTSDAAISPLQFEIGFGTQIEPVDADAGTTTYVSGSWSFFRFVSDEPTEPIWTLAQAGTTVHLEEDLKKVHDDNGLITSFDFATADGSRASYGLVAVRNDDSRPLFDITSTGSVSRDALARSVSDAAARGLVTTALSGDGMGVRYFAYNWIGDQQRYETDVRHAQLDHLSDQARELADAGYIITAFGRDGSDLLLVGTRPAGTSTARSISMLSFEHVELPPDLDAAPVASIFTPNGTLLLLEE